MSSNLNKSASGYAVVQFSNHSYDYRPNWTPLSPVTIICESVCNYGTINFISSARHAVICDPTYEVVE